MEIRDLHYDPRARAYQANVCIPHAGRIVTIPARVKSRKPLRPALLTDILAHRAARILEPTHLSR